MSRTEHLGTILTMTTGRLVAPAGFDAVHSLADYLTGDQLFTHQFADQKLWKECGGELLRQHPDLADVEVPAEFAEPAQTSVYAWLAEQVARYGEYREVAPMGPGVHVHKDPLRQLAEMTGDKPMIVVVAEPDDAAS
jgi:hypothetical protein